MISDKVTQKLDAVQIPAGYGVAAGLTSTPIWLESVTTYLEFLIVVVGLLIGISTLYWNYLKIREHRENLKNSKEK